MMTNPYESLPSVAVPAGPRPAERNWSAVVIWICGMLAPLLSFVPAYACWLLAAVSLGRWPVPSLDDPYQISPLISWSCTLAVSVLVLWPLFHVIGFLTIWVCPVERVRNRKLWLLLLSAVWIACCWVQFRIVRRDPAGVFNWLMD